MYADRNVNPRKVFGKAEPRLPHAARAFIDHVADRAHRRWRQRNMYRVAVDNGIVEGLGLKHG